MNPATRSTPNFDWPRLREGTIRTFHAYANWLVGISWKRFIVLSILLLVAASILEEMPPFRWTVTETIENDRPTRSTRKPVQPPTPPAPPVETVPQPPTASGGKAGGAVDIRIDEHGIRITPKDLEPAGQAASAAASAAQAASAAASVAADGITISVPANVDREAIREAINDARDAIREAIEDQKQAARDAADAAREAADAAREAAAEDEEIVIDSGGRRIRRIHWGDFLSDLALLWIMGSALIKGTYKGRIQAEAKAAQATETAEAEALRRQVVEARMAAMQAQVEPHFLFNTLASIDHLIETDPPRASQMQKNLIALLRASMPTMRETGDGGVRELGREVGVIRPYLEILKVRMEERLTTVLDVPDGLLSAEFPPMMIQTLVENAIKHGLEPKAEGGTLTVRAQVVHGKLQVTVADTGLGFGKAATAGTGVGLANVRERLQLLYGNKGTLTVSENQPSGTVVTITVPYRPVEGAGASAAA
ncbi:sensor histidine kinase [Rubrivivax gelatinosus]|uniref:histidine kinase n=1 Tax=Rubrivivax gelatinosus TaxID=28068 RepID=A0ABS1DQM6_RUBGE|nr:histidine kinase [Rubrivivax gelatinosus]MBK1712031.1 histidine kinase [Rubrivivax gelatinosus]